MGRLGWSKQQLTALAGKARADPSREIDHACIFPAPRCMLHSTCVCVCTLSLSSGFGCMRCALVACWTVGFGREDCVS